MNFLTNILFQDGTMKCVDITLFDLQGEQYKHIKKGTQCTYFDFNQFLILFYFNFIPLFGVIIFNSNYGIHCL
jgi:hypothetical protein